MRPLLGAVLGLVARLWLATLRIEILEHPGCSAPDPRGPRPWVLVFFHGQQFALLGWKRRPGRRTVVLVSLSRDGDIQAAALPRVGLEVRRGSSSRGGVRGLAAIVRLLRAPGWDAAFAVDGPRGPLGTVHPGAIAAARNAGGLVVPLATASASAWVLERAWDRFELPWPFTRVVVALGQPIEPTRGRGREVAAAGGGGPEQETLERRLGAELVALRRVAEARLGEHRAR
jgi:lysophospholipid acyltransferase (LPLAT)-like uncharacterized protein